MAQRCKRKTCIHINYVHICMSSVGERLGKLGAVALATLTDGHEITFFDGACKQSLKVFWDIIDL